MSPVLILILLLLLVLLYDRSLFKYNYVPTLLYDLEKCVEIEISLRTVIENRKTKAYFVLTAKTCNCPPLTVEGNVILCTVLPVVSATLV